VRIFLIIVVVLLAGGTAAALLAGPGLRDSLARFKPQPSRTDVRIETVRQDRLVQTVSAPGEIEPLTKVEISAEVSARILELPLRENDPVRKGDVLVKLDDRDLQAARVSAVARRDAERFRLDSERARIEGLLSSLSFAQKHLTRQEELFSTGDVPRKAVDDAMERVQDIQSALDSARHSISVIQSGLAAAEADIIRADEGLARTIIHSPIDGVMTLLNAEVGELVVVGTMNSPGTVILTVADLSRMILKAKVPESDITKVAAGQTAKIYINAFADDVFNGRVRRVALQRTPGIGQESSYFLAEVEVDRNGQQLLSGLAANVDIEIATHEGLLVPSQAVVDRLIEKLPSDIVQGSSLVDKGKKTASVVFREIEGKAVCTPVKVGQSDLTRSVILDGLQDGDRILTGPYKVLATIEHESLVREQTAPTPGQEPGVKAVPATQASSRSAR
jgi:HlyD family secretion protein